MPAHGSCADWVEPGGLCGRAAVAAQWAHDLDPLAPAIQPTGSALGDALSAIGNAVVAIRLRLGTAATPWQLIGRISDGQLLTPAWPSGG